MNVNRVQFLTYKALFPVQTTQTTAKIKERVSSVKVIALSVHADKRFVSKMLEAGASGYILKECAFDELINAIRTVAKNSQYLSPKIEAAF
jgi:DNA-binding NarL/FixJ family response regulator